MPVSFDLLPSASRNADRRTRRESGRCQCGRCRGFFRAGSGDVPRSVGDWWACPPCTAEAFRVQQAA
jgi:hypothetical protein